MSKSERIKSGAGRVGPGGLRCDCCGRQAGRRGASQRRFGRKVVRGIRRDSEALAIAEGLQTIAEGLALVELAQAEALKVSQAEARVAAQAEALKVSQESDMWAAYA